jgi:hypothetical protein
VRDVRVEIAVELPRRIKDGTCFWRESFPSQPLCEKAVFVRGGKLRGNVDVGTRPATYIVQQERIEVVLNLPRPPLVLDIS